MELPRFKVIYAPTSWELENMLAAADPHDDYEVKQMTSGPWFSSDGDGRLVQTGDSVYVLLERKTTGR